MSGERLPVTKTFKLFINGAFPRTESGRSIKIEDGAGGVVAHTCHASRKDLRNAVEAAGKAQAKWAGATAYLRGQIVYRLAEMMEGKRAELRESLIAAGGVDAGRADDEINASIDRCVAFAGWSDKIAQVLGCANPVSGPYHNFTVPEPTGVVGVVAPDQPALLGMITLVVPAITAGNAVVALASESNPIPAMVLAEALATSDLAAGIVNILTGKRPELMEHFASHRAINAVVAAGVDQEARTVLEAGAAENLKRVMVLGESTDFNDNALEGLALLEGVIESKTFWHPSAT